MSIIKSIHTSGTEGRFDESVTYNANGSILSLLRGGMRNDGTFGTIDDLTITYNGNRLLKVTDAAEAVNYSNALDFHDGDDKDIEYTYDSNGALIEDKNRGISSITYDYGHHPNYINMSQGRGKVRYITNDYTPDGRKLSSSHKTSVSTANGRTLITTTDQYIDGLILRDGVPLLWQFDGGYVDLDANGAPTSWNYYVTDHLGSTRMVVDSNDSIKEVINYYPFGSEMQMTNPAQMTSEPSHPFRFTGKELDRQNGLNMYDFGARLFDVAGVPMWTSIDPLAEKNPNMTPYHFCHDNPVNRIDPDGMDDYFDDKGEFIKRTDTGTDVMVMNDDEYKNIAEVDFSNSKNIIENIGRHYLAKADKGEFDLNATNTGGDIPQDAVFSNNAGTSNYNIYLTNGYVNKTLGNCYNFECVTYHESTHRYDSSTHGGTVGEVNSIIRTASECPAWYSASDD